MAGFRVSSQRRGATAGPALAEAQSIFTGLKLIGAGTIWIDDLKLEVVEP